MVQTLSPSAVISTRCLLRSKWQQLVLLYFLIFFFLNDPATPDISSLPHPDPLPISTTPAATPTPPGGAMIGRVNSGASCRPCCGYGESPTTPPPFHRPSRKASVVPSRSPLRCSR